MEFKDKIQSLRKQHNMTQEEMASKLFVSRTAVSKWETGKGYPSLDSLQAISKLFEMTIGELLSTEEAITIAHDTNRKKILNISLFVLSFLDILSFIIMFLPFFGNKEGNEIFHVSLLNYRTSINMLIPYYISFSVLGIMGIVELVLAIFKYYANNPIIHIVSSVIMSLCLLLFVASTQPYVSLFLILCLAIKQLLLIPRYMKMK